MLTKLMRTARQRKLDQSPGHVTPCDTAGRTAQSGAHVASHRTTRRTPVLLVTSTLVTAPIIIVMSTLTE